MKKISLQDLNVLYSIVEKLYRYYDNQAKANEGQYNTEFQDIESKEAKAKCSYYLGCKQEIIAEMEKIVNETFA